jgi:hypothetical protein
VLYFAYGSNMDWAQMKERCPSARFVAKAVFPDHKLAFTRRSVRRACGVADAKGAPGEDLWGVLYEIADHDIPKLDKCEGYRPHGRDSSYYPAQIEVFIDDVRAKSLPAKAYFAYSEPAPPPPSTAYLKQIIGGACYWGLPPDYLAKLGRIPTAP